MNRQVHFIEQLTLILTAAATLVTMLLAELPVTLGVGIGGALAAANFFALRRLMLGIAGSAERPRQVVLLLLLIAKFGIVAGIIYLVLTQLPVQAVAMLVGVSFVVIAIFIDSLRTMLRGATAPSDS